MRIVAALTILTLSPALVERACNTSTTDVSHLNNLVSPLLNSSNARACSWNISRIELESLQLSILSASGWLRRSFPVCLVYFTRVALKSVSKLEEVGAVLEGDDMG